MIPSIYTPLRIFAIGDIHGEYDKLEVLLDTLKAYHNLDLKGTDKLIFMGDYVDRGPDSFRVLVTLYNLQKKHPNNVICLAGNHEYLMLDWCCGNDRWDLWGINGGNKTRASFNYYTGKPICPTFLKNWVKKLPLQYEDQGFFFSHAPIGNAQFRGTSSETFNQHDLTWTFFPNEADAHVHANGGVGVCGHIHALKKGIKAPRFYDHYIYTDAGCGCHPEAPLCAVEVISREVIYSI